MANVINWFEIPAANFDRAKEFYGKVLGGEIHEQSFNNIKLGFLPREGEGVTGAIASSPMHKPSKEGSLVYLNGGNDLAEPLARVEEAGGVVTMPKTKISDEVGYMAVFEDSEGNAIAFHSPN